MISPYKDKNFLKKLDTIVLDVGSRYGIHPSWKKFSGELKYYLIEADIDEANRLKKKYINRRNEIFISNHALSDKNGK